MAVRNGVLLATAKQTVYHSSRDDWTSKALVMTVHPDGQIDLHCSYCPVSTDRAYAIMLALADHFGYGIVDKAVTDAVAAAKGGD